MLHCASLVLCPTHPLTYHPTSHPAPPRPRPPGIVHRDVKPQNCIIAQSDRRVKLIDLGAAADLRVGINYVPNQFLLDPRYAPPQQYIMSTQTPR